MKNNLPEIPTPQWSISNLKSEIPNAERARPHTAKKFRVLRWCHAICGLLTMGFMFIGCSKSQTDAGSAKDVPALDFSSIVPASVYQCLEELKVDRKESGQSDADSLVLSGRVLDSTNQTVANARLACWVRPAIGPYILLGKTTSDINGKYTLDISAFRSVSREHEFITVSDHELAGFDTDWSVYSFECTKDPGYAGIQNLEVFVFAASPSEHVGWAAPQILLSRSLIPCDLQLRDGGGEIRGIVTNDSGLPLANEEVQIRSLTFHESPYYPLDFYRPLVVAGWKTKTDSKGRFAFLNLPQKAAADLKHTRVWTSGPAGRDDPNLRTQTSPCTIKIHESRPLECFGRVESQLGKPVEGAVIRIGVREAKSDANGDYRIQFDPGNPARISVMPPPGSIDVAENVTLALKALREHHAQPPIRFIARQPVYGRVISSKTGLPLQDIVIQNQTYSGTDGHFQVSAFLGVNELIVIPGWLTKSELSFYEENGKSSRIPIRSVRDEKLDLGALKFDDRDERSALSVRVVLPDGQPAINASVRFWARSKANSKQVYYKKANQVVFGETGYQQSVSTDANGVCSVLPVFTYGKEEYLTVAFPEIDPRYFGEMKLSPSTKDPVVLSLSKAIPIRGQITFNAKPLAHARVRAEVADQESGGQSYVVLAFDGVSDRQGNYEIYAPDSASYNVSIREGVLLAGRLSIENTHIPAMANRPPDANEVTGPALSILYGEGIILGKVVNEKGRDWTDASVRLKPQPGQIVLGGAPGKDGPGFTLLNVPDGRFELEAYLHPSRRPDGPDTVMHSTTPAASAGDSNVVIRLTRAKEK